MEYNVTIGGTGSSTSIQSQNICYAKGLEVCRIQGLIVNTCKTFYIYLQTLYNQHSYAPDHVWNSYEIGIQVPRHTGIKALVKRRSNVVSSTDTLFQALY